ncbi:MAG: LCP family protein [Eubacteriales bacterium]|nr:LCP family protein [Eubacteriales bacterium]
MNMDKNHSTGKRRSENIRSRHSDRQRYDNLPEEDDLFDDIDIEYDDSDDDETYDTYDSEDDWSREEDIDTGWLDDDADDKADFMDDDFMDDDKAYDDMEDMLYSQAMKQKGQKKNFKELNSANQTVDRNQKKKEKEQKKKKGIKNVIIAILVEALTLCCIFGYGYFLRKWNLITRPEINDNAIENNNISVEKKKEMEGYWNIAIFGVDARGNTNLGKGLNSDVIMIASINMATGDIKLCSVFRDTYLNISDSDKYNKINQAYAQGGPEQALAALNKNLDLNIKHYITFNWKAVADGINILGGIDDIEISKAELYYINAYITETVNATGVGSHQLKKTGKQHLDGVQAVAYARLRNMDNDFARTERQKNVIKACFEKAKKADFSVLNNIMVVCFPQVATNISMGDAVKMAQGITKYNLVDTGGFPWARGDARIPGKGACVIPATLESNVVMLHEFLFGEENYQPSSAVIKYSQKIKEDSNLYKEGKPIESVRTDQGVIQKPKTEAPETQETETEKPTELETEEYTYGTDENGKLIYPTNEDGDVVFPTDEEGKIIYPTDEEGNLIKPSTNHKPGERPTDELIETGGDAGSDIVDNEGNVIIPGETENGPHTKPTNESESQGHITIGPTSGSTESGGNAQTKPSETQGQRPGESQKPAKPQTPEESSGNSNITEIPDEPVVLPKPDNSGNTAPGGAGNSGMPGNAGNPGNSGPGNDLSNMGPGGV